MREKRRSPVGESVLKIRIYLNSSLLDDLDPDIIADLEVRVRERQVERLPISKGEILLHDLAARYPDLEDDILQEHEARQFTANFSTSLPSSFGTTTGPSTPIEAKHAPSKSSIGRKGRRSATLTANSPNLRPLASDLIFDMDDDLDVRRGSPSGKHVSPVERLEKTLWRDVNGKPLKDQPPTFLPAQRFRILPESVSTDLNGTNGWCEVEASGKTYGSCVM